MRSPSNAASGARGASDSHVRRPRDGEFGIHQILAAASPGDAITNVALEYRDVLRRVGPSEIFARHIAPGSAGEVRPLSEYGAGGSRGLLVYHSSIGEPTVSAFLLSRPEPIVLVYHNITPAKYFDGIDDTFAELLVLGRLELESIRHRVVLSIAASQFNAAELEAIGYEDVRVIPPVVDPFRLLRTAPDAADGEPPRPRVRRSAAPLRRPAAAAQASRPPREGDARRRDLLRARRRGCSSSDRTGSRATPTR